MAIQQRVGTLERAVAQLVEEGALGEVRMEKAFDRLSATLESHAMQTATTLESHARQTSATLESHARQTAATLESHARQTAATLVQMRQDTEDFKRGLQRDTKDLKKKWGELANRLGTLVEDIVAPNVRGVAAAYFDAPVMDSFSVRVFRRRHHESGTEREFDVVAYTDVLFFLVDVKTDPRPEYALEFVDFLPQIPEYFPEAMGKRIVPVFSSPQISDSTLKYLTRHGVYGMVMGQDNMTLANYEEVEAGRRATP